MAKSAGKIKDKAMAWIKSATKSKRIVFEKKDIDATVLKYLKAEKIAVDLSKDYTLLKLKELSAELFVREQFWKVISQYLNLRFHNNWYLTGKHAYLTLSDSPQIPASKEQLTIATKSASNTLITLMDTFTIAASTDRNFHKNKVSKKSINDTKVNVLRDELLVIGSNPDQYKSYQEEIVSYLKSSKLDSDYITNYFDNNNSPVLLNRLIGALEQIANYDLKFELEKILELSSSSPAAENPFSEESYMLLPEMPEYQLRFEISIEKAKQCLKKLKKPKKLKKKFADIQNIAISDGYHSLTIEGYEVTEELMKYAYDEAAQKPKLSTEEDEEDLRNRSAAKGFMYVIRFIEQLIKRPIMFNENLSKELYRSLWKPSIAAGIIDKDDIYRNRFVSIRGSHHVPPNYEKIPRLLESFYKHANDFDDAFEQAIFLHYFYVTIHPHIDGNGRMSRFLLNLALVNGNYKWLTILKGNRKKYFQALELSNVNDDISYFANFILDAYTSQS